jgi:hypothetical protein
MWALVIRLLNEHSTLRNLPDFDRSRNTAVTGFFIRHADSFAFFAPLREMNYFRPHAGKQPESPAEQLKNKRSSEDEADKYEQQRPIDSHTL